MKPWRLAMLLTTIALLVAAPAAQAAGGKGPTKRANPMIFVHGGFGSGAQFESQALRFASNGYSPKWVRVLDYDSGFGVESQERVHERLDALVADAKRDTGRRKVDLLGHSLGTRVLQAYLSSPARAANVARYVNIDGFARQRAARRRAHPRRVGGRRHSRPLDPRREERDDPEPDARAGGDVGRVLRPLLQVLHRATSEVGHQAPARPHHPRREGGVVPAERRGRGKEARHLRGRRARAAHAARPVATPRHPPRRSWGPVRRLKSGRRYEFALSRTTGVHHIYSEPFLRSDYLVRLLTSEPGAGADALAERGPRHGSAVSSDTRSSGATRAAENDVLRINGTNVINAGTAPVSKRAIAVFTFDRGSDGRSDVSSAIPLFAGLPFLTGVDVFMPASSPTTGTVRARLRSRGRGPARDVSFPNFPSSTDRVSVQFHDYEETGSGRSSRGKKK